MRRLRLLRLFLLALLVPFIVILVRMYRHPVVGRTPGPTVAGQRERAQDIKFTDFFEGIAQFDLKAVKIEAEDDGSYRFEDVWPLRIYRRDGSALVVRAPRGSVAGGEGRRLLRLEGGVEVEDEGGELTLSLPALEFNQAAGEVRSIGAVEFRGPRYHGRAESVVYALDQRPTVLQRPELSDKDGSTLRAERATLLDGTRDVEFENRVRLSGGARGFEGARLRVTRREDGSLERLVASGDVRGEATPPGGPATQIEAERAEAAWDENGRARSLHLEGHARVRHGGGEIVAHRIEAARRAPAPWSVSAWGDVYASTLLETGPATLRAAEMKGRIDAAGKLLSGEARGDVRFVGRETSADAERATFEPQRADRELSLYGTLGHRAHLEQRGSRVAADRIFTDPAGTNLLAEVGVEASLLPVVEAGKGRSEPGSLFRHDEAVHFVSGRLQGNPARGRLEFVGDVRGWQGERNLRADRVQIDRPADSLMAEGQVGTRIPRLTSGAVSEADFVQITADGLDYRGAEGTGTYEGGVRVRQAEGFMQSDKLVVELGGENDGVREMRASGDIRFEFRAPDSGGIPRPVTGTGDRLVYVPAERRVTLFGDRAPAAVRRSGEAGGTTSGRVLRYHLDTGALEVESGDRDRATIRTPEG